LHGLRASVIVWNMLPTHNTPQKALEFETAITERFKNPDVTQVLEFWTTDQSLVAPTSLKSAPDFSRACKTLERAGWPVVERKSGGGITPQGPGVLNIALAYAPDPVETPTIQGVYQMFCSPLINLVKSFGEDANTASVPGSFCDGDYNVVVNERKLMGTAQRWVRVRALEPRQVIFVHALILLLFCWMRILQQGLTLLTCCSAVAKLIRLYWPGRTLI